VGDAAKSRRIALLTTAFLESCVSIQQRVVAVPRNTYRYACGPQKEWQEQSDLSHIKLQLVLLENQVEHLKMLTDAQQSEIEVLQRQVKKMTPAQKAAPKTRMA